MTDRERWERIAYRETGAHLDLATAQADAWDVLPARAESGSTPRPARPAQPYRTEEYRR